MPKRFSNRPSRKFTSSAPAPVRRSATAPTTGPSMKDSMKQGFGLGLGLEGARAAIGAIGGVFSSGDSSQQQTAPVHTQSEPGIQPTQQPTTQSTNEPTEVCGLERKLYDRCLDETGNADNECADFFKLYENCTNKL